jgi:FkbM family methyltransferase
LNQIRNVTIVTAAVGPAAGTTRFVVRDDDSRGSALEAVHNSAIDNVRGRRIEVPCTTLEALLHEVPGPAVVKMDIEGAEDLIIPAAESFFTGPKRPRVLVLAYHGADTGSRCLQLLRQYGYELGLRAGFESDATKNYGTLLWYPAAS